jgi:hypothetical protein
LIKVGKAFEDFQAMLARSKSAQRSFTILALSGLFAMTSCGTDDGLGKRYPVSGTVTYNGKPLEQGVISFVPEDPKSIGATGTIENGAYALSTGGENDGARAGKYKVTVSAKEDSTALAKAKFAKDSKGADPGFVPRQYLSNAAGEAKSLIPVGYGDTRTTNLTAEVKEQPNTIDFPLSDTDAPPAPPAQDKGRGGKGS